MYSSAVDVYILSFELLASSELHPLLRSARGGRYSGRVFERLFVLERCPTSMYCEYTLSISHVVSLATHALLLDARTRAVVHSQRDTFNFMLICAIQMDGF